MQKVLLQNKIFSQYTVFFSDWILRMLYESCVLQQHLFA